MGCFITILFLCGFVLIMVTFIRWFEQTAEAVDNGWWNKVFVLIMCPFTVWFFPSTVNAGRATPVPRHEPVRGFGSMPKAPTAPTAPERAPAPASGAEKALAEAGEPAAPVTDQPPPGTPKEFLGVPQVPPPQSRKKPSVDPDKIARLKQKMREQGMLPPEEQ